MIQIPIGSTGVTNVPSLQLMEIAEELAAIIDKTKTV